MSRKHKKDEALCPIYGKAIDEKYCLNECLINDCGNIISVAGQNQVQMPALSSDSKADNGISEP